MKDRTLKLVLLWNAALTAVLIGSVLLNANFVMASNDPPVQVFTATMDHAGGADGGGTTGNTSITSDTTWSQLSSVSINFGTQGHTHQCVAIGSADIINPFGGAANDHQSYRFDLSLDSTNPGTDTISERIVDFVNNSNTAAGASVTTNRAFLDIANGAHTVRFMARRSAGGSVSASVTDASMSVICLKVKQ